ncbi:LysR family transcriptional regulator [Pelosinus fermentans]|uniref:Transcriptional regulator, LysR family n=1 Tax=Pelosinus fermentans JBW45 TaxID=1192197 RepID=I9DJW3_9FIRM|nr:LysR family transcriptional regulator [Pelosinus fermentans]AJQ29853.1 transcriptional regulator, LysR family [Pelosinus fermentans JBW45]
MDNKDWLMLRTISEEKNITKAAERLYISQPALSYRLKNLEKEFGAKIVLRNTTGVVFTHQGEYLLNYALKMLTQLTSAKEHIQNMENKIQGTLRIGTSAIFAHYELPEILKGFLESYPDVDISLKTGLSSRINKMLQKDEFAVAILRGDPFWPEEKHMLQEEHICLTSRNVIKFHDLPHLPRINYGTDSSLREMLENWWLEIFPCPPNITMEVDSMDTCRQMVLHGLGWAILPFIGLKEHDSLYTQELHWRDGTPVLRRTWMLYRNSSLELSAVHAFVNYIKTYYDRKKSAEL